MKTLRQGDVLLVRIREDRRKGKAVESVDGRLILAHGEATGHTHSVAASVAEQFTVEDSMFLRMIERGELVHQEHDAVTLDRGLYRVIRQSEYAPEAILQVAD